MSEDRKILWVVLMTDHVNGRAAKRPFLVSAETTSEAVRLVIERSRLGEHLFNVQFECFPIGAEELRDAAPDLRKLAEAFWYRAVESCGLDRGEEIEAEYFDAAWQEHGPNAEFEDV